MLGATVLDMSDFPTRHPYSLGIWQNAIERIMAAWVAELEVQIYYGSAVTGFTQDEEGVEVEVTMGEPPEGTRHDAIGIRYEGECELPVLGPVTAPAAVLVRPDGYVCWVDDGDDSGLPDALTTWFGLPSQG